MKSCFPFLGFNWKVMNRPSFFLGIGGLFFCICGLGLEGGGAKAGSGWRFLLKSVFKNSRNCFNRYFLL